VQAKSAVAVLGATIATTLFGDADIALGQTVRINRQPFRVIGVLVAKGGTGFGSQDNVIMVPITTMTTRLAAQRTAQGVLNVSTITIQVADAKEIDQTKDQITELLRQRHRITTTDDFTVTAQEDLLDALRQVTGVFTLFLGSIAGISLVVGGIGIMNIMLVSVTERTREIGIRKAIGAKRQDILLQFLAESAALSLTGGIVGIALGSGLSRLISGTSLQGQVLTTVVSPNIVVLAASVSVAIGLFFGIYPASRAARLRPIEALRYE
jgi:putative ABC transport system permease protein